MSIAASAQPQWLTTVDIIKRLVRLKRITQEEGEKFLSSPRSKSELALHPIEQVVNSGLIDHNSGKAFDLEELSSWLAKEAGQPYFHIDPLKIDARGVASLMSFAYAQRHRILGVEIHKDHVVIASAEPFVTGWEDNLRHVVRKDIKRVVANPADIRRFTVEFYRLATSVDKAVGGRGETSAAIGNFEQLLELGNVANPDANDQHIVNIVDWLLQYAFDQRASDIHIEPRREIGQVRFRIDGVLHNVYELPMQVSMAVVSRLKILGRLNVAEKRKPQDGRIKTKNPDGLEIELRLSTLPTAFGEKLVMRVFDPDVLLRSFSDLGFGQDDSRRWNSMTSQPNGIILVTGPTGSGKTTTLYSTLKSLATSEVNVCSIEDPIEMVEPAFNQMQVQSGIGVTFASGVRALLRQDPDIIMVGEIRDLETAEMAIQAALTGHLVLSTLHTNDAPSAITRLLELGVPGYLVKATVLGVMAQRLVRVLCPNCKEPTTIDDKDWQNLIQPWKASKPDHACAPVGCLECRNTGYRGRAGVYEVMLLSESVKESINEQCDLERIRKVAVKEGMRTLRLSGAQKVANGMTTIEEVLRVTPSSSLAII
ncbi:GspE/PulE family protein [Hahella aquimaris]|uniref:GspE/PulE family protein n=1 Tax=Hahella sp. HNIBRBA332 TaxID=3015983 RepID=UPI00273BB8C9|nr:GspE/PulE family protein [Hahella sp. HNIBRBA332]WLQ11466.1 GspE/PulE family protein [Hahella sp. HNIBRBA332]